MSGDIYCLFYIIHVKVFIVALAMGLLRYQKSAWTVRYQTDFNMGNPVDTSNSDTPAKHFQKNMS